MPSTKVTRKSKKVNTPLPYPDNQTPANQPTTALCGPVVNWSEDTRLITGSIREAIKWYIETFTCQPEKIYICPKNEKYLPEAGEIPVIMRHGVLRGEVWLSIKNIPAGHFQNTTYKPPEPQQTDIPSPQHQILILLKKPKAKQARHRKTVTPKNKPSQRVITPRVMKHAGGRPRLNGSLSRTTKFRRNREKQMEMVELINNYTTKKGGDK